MYLDFNMFERLVVPGTFYTTTLFSCFVKGEPGQKGQQGLIGLPGPQVNFVLNIMTDIRRM